MVFTYDGTGDVYARVMDVWAHHYYPSSGIWMPLPHYFIKLSLLLYNDVSVAPRVAAVALNVLIIVSLFLLTRSIFHSTSISLLAITLFVINPFLGFFSTIPITELLFILFFISGLVFLFQKNPMLGLSLLFFNLANATRYEGWYLFPILLLYVIKTTSSKQTILFSITYFVYPIYWILQNYFHTGNAFSFYYEKLYWARQTQGYQWFNLSLPVQIWSEKLIRHSGIITIFLGVLTFLYSFKNLKVVILFLSALFLFVALIFQVYLGTMEWYPDQYLYTSCILLLPLAAYGLHLFLKWLYKTKTPLVLQLASIIFIIIILGFNSFQNDFSQFIQKRELKIPEISLAIKKFPKSQFIFIYTDETYPSKRDSYMYFAKHDKYSIQKEWDNFPLNTEAYVDQGSFLITPKSRFQLVKDYISEDAVIYADDEYVIWHF